MRIREGDMLKAAFRTNKGLFEPLVMYFRLYNSSATFQLMMDSLLWELINTGKIVVYMNNILIFTKTLEEHHNIVDQVLAILEKNKLILQSNKCLFYQTKIDYLSVIISKDSIKVNPTKIKRISE